MRLPRYSVVAVTAVLIIPTILLLSLWALNKLDGKRSATDRYDVYSAYLNQQISANWHDYAAGAGCRVVIWERTRRSIADGGRLGDDFRSLFLSVFRKKGIPEAQDTTFRNFVLRNLWTERVASNFNLSTSYELATDTEIGLFGAEDGSFDSRFPGNCGYVTFSAIGFNRQRSEAYFYTEHVCGLCGGGRYVLMRRQNSWWEIIEEHYVWIS